MYISSIKLGYLLELVPKTIRKSLFVLQLSGHRGLGLGVCPDDGVDLLNLSVEIVLLHCQLLLHNVHIIDGPGDVNQAGVGCVDAGQVVAPVLGDLDLLPLLAADLPVLGRLVLLQHRAAVLNVPLHMR